MKTIKKYFIIDTNVFEFSSSTKRRNIKCINQYKKIEWVIELSPIKDDYYIYIDYFNRDLVAATHKQELFMIDENSGKILKWKL